MRKPTRSARSGRGERVLPGVWRLRLPLPWPGVPHCNAWALAAGDGIVLVDTGHARAAARWPTSSARSTRPGCGSSTSGCRQHPRPRRPLRPGAADRRARRLRGLDAPRLDHLHADDDDAGADARPPIEVARQCGVPGGAAASAGPSSGARSGRRLGRAALRRPRPRPRRDGRDRPRRPGRSIETPGHAPSHVCLHQPERRLLISRRPPARPRLAVLRRRLHAGPGAASSWTRSTASTRSTRGSRSPATAARSPTSQAHIDANRALVAERLDARPRGARRRARRPPTSSRARVYGEAFTEATASWLMTQDARLAHPPASALGEVRATEPAEIARQPRALGSPRRLARDADRRADRGRRPSRPSPSSSSRRRPTRASATSPPRWTSSPRWTRRSSRSPTAPAARPPSAARRSTSSRASSADYGLEAMAHFTCVGATVDELRATLDRMRDAGHRERARAARRPAAGRRREWTATEGGLRYSRELIELIRADYDFAIGAACFPEVHIHAESRRVRPALPQGEGRRRRALPDHAAVLRQRATTTTSSARAREIGIDVPIIPGIMPITNVGQIQRITEMCGAVDPARSLRRRARRARRRRRAP